MNTCPVCQGPATLWCRCLEGNRWCAQQHHWKPCAVHRDEAVVLPDDYEHASTDECTCSKKEEEATLKRKRETEEAEAEAKRQRKADDEVNVRPLPPPPFLPSLHKRVAFCVIGEDSVDSRYYAMDGPADEVDRAHAILVETLCRETKLPRRLIPPFAAAMLRAMEPEGEDAWIFSTDAKHMPFDTLFDRLNAVFENNPINMSLKAYDLDDKALFYLPVSALTVVPGYY
jgi:hypothetical protein